MESTSAYRVRRDLGLFDFFRGLSSSSTSSSTSQRRRSSRRASAPPHSAPTVGTSARSSLPPASLDPGSLSSPSSASGSSASESASFSAPAPPVELKRAALDSLTTTASVESSTGEEEEVVVAAAVVTTATPAPVAGEVLAAIHDYEVVRELGRGATAVVQLGRRKKTVQNTSEEELVALKVFRTSLLRKMRDVKRVGRRMVVSTALDKVQIEIAIMKKLHHRNLLNLLEVFDDDTETLVLMLEYAPHGQVMHWHPADRVYRRSPPASPEDGPPTKKQPVETRFSERELQNCVRQLLLGLEYLHANHICHRDLKPENILLGRDGTYKIADFGVAHFFAEEEAKKEEEKEAKPPSSASKRGLVSTTAGTYAFMGPETLRGGEYSAYTADVWALGVTIHALAFGSIPFYDQDVVELFEQIESRTVEIDNNAALAAGYSDGLVDLLLGMLEKDPEKRWTIEECKQHPWVLSGMDDVVERGTFLEAKPDCVEVNEVDVARAVTRVTSLSVVLRIKLGTNRWMNRTRRSMEARKRSSLLSSGSSSVGSGSLSGSDSFSTPPLSSASARFASSQSSTIADVPEENEDEDGEEKAKAAPVVVAIGDNQLEI